MDTSTDDNITTSDTPSATAPMHDDYDLDPPARTQAPLWPMVLLAIALIALAVGGWLTFTERQTLIAELTESQAALASLQTQSAEARSERAELEALREEVAGLRADLAEARRRYTALSHQMVTHESTHASSPNETSVQAPLTGAAQQSQPDRPNNFAGHSGDGPWFINISSYSNLEFARDWRQRVIRLSEVAEHSETVTLRQADVNGTTMHRLRVEGFDTREAAIDAARQLETALDIGPLWIGRRSAEANPDPKPTTDQPDEAPVVQGSDRSQARAPSAAEPLEAATPTAIPSPPRPAGWYIHIKTFNYSDPAKNLANDLKKAGHDARVSVESRNNRLWYRVLVIGAGDPLDEQSLLRELAVLSGVANLQLRRYRSAP